MTYPTFDSLHLGTNSQKFVDGALYTSDDARANTTPGDAGFQPGTPWPFRNTVVDQTLCWLRFMPVLGGKLEVFAHLAVGVIDPGVPNPPALGKDAAGVPSAGTPTVTAETPYNLADQIIDDSEVMGDTVRVPVGRSRGLLFSSNRSVRHPAGWNLSHMESIIRSPRLSWCRKPHATWRPRD